MVRPVAAVAGAWLLCFGAALHATVIRPIEFHELVAGARVILHARVLGVRAQWADGRRRVETLVTLEAEEYLKGQLGEQITIRVPGGQLGRYRTIMIGAPAFTAGQDLVLFLDSSGPSLPFVFGLSQGVFRVVVDPARGAFVTPPLLEGRTTAPQPLVRGAMGRQPVPLAAFEAAVRQAIGDTVR
ncbi:MAG TPA: hypothetical protein VFX12_06915 [Vicinamibacterales bacterium]|nr:hypothetical protein [Vicinamibacterales bacterium]